MERYSSAGVDVERADRFVERLKARARRPGHDNLWRGAGGYAAVYPVSESEAVAVTTDGVGTKLLVACTLGRYETIGIDLVAMCANDLICVGATPTVFLDYLATGRLDDRIADEIISGIVTGCDESGMILAGGETAEMPGVYEGQHFDLAGFALGRVTRSKLITGEQIRPGQAVIGVASSGIHSNGLTLARKVLPRDDKTCTALLTPTLIYTRAVVRALDEHAGEIKGIAHITGGGWRNLFRLNRAVGYHISSPLPRHDIFEQLAAHVPEDEMYKTFNMGMGLCMIVEGEAEPILELLRKANLAAQVVGVVTEKPMTLTIERSTITLRG
jgi:phosphoribosylformylglycinamidine cyclo-ligase